MGTITSASNNIGMAEAYKCHTGLTTVTQKASQSFTAINIKLVLKNLDAIAQLYRNCGSALIFMPEFDSKYPTTRAGNSKPCLFDPPDQGDDYINDVKRWINKLNHYANRLVAEAYARAVPNIPLSDSDKQDKDSPELSTHSSYTELWAVMSAFIGKIKKDYVDFYGRLMQLYTEMYEYFNSYAQKGASDSVSDSGKENNVYFSPEKMGEAYANFDYWMSFAEARLGNIPNWETLSPDERKRITDTLAPAFQVDTKSGKITFNLDQYNKVKDTYPGGDGRTISLPVYNSWLATFNAAGSALQSNMQTFAQRFSQANTSFDNLNRTLSNMINSMGESAKDTIKSLV